jgi:hypothetical protein
VAHFSGVQLEASRAVRLAVSLPVVWAREAQVQVVRGALVRVALSMRATLRAPAFFGR